VTRPTTGHASDIAAPARLLEDLQARERRLTRIMIQVDRRQRGWLAELQRQGFSASEVLRYLIDYAMEAGEA
jgi:hypothetical protein